jgi:hypothetical protein
VVHTGANCVDMFLVREVAVMFGFSWLARR